ncbi:PIG-L family deacetylase [Leucobacter luti]|uniref:PIG-L family deacetylase n=1 Tax=Leucobacter luti TaxID=340320 RepID=UPI00215D74DE|nr:PIG-L family deacetylase [Leucobacter luti]
MFVHAHPDDESISTGGTLAALASAGREPLLVTLTRGERGEVVPGPFAHLAGTDALAPTARRSSRRPYLCSEWSATRSSALSRRALRASPR